MCESRNWDLPRDAMFTATSWLEVCLGKVSELRNPASKFNFTSVCWSI
jgi:hypothetical protein